MQVIHLQDENIRVMNDLKKMNDELSKLVKIPKGIANFDSQTDKNGKNAYKTNQM